MSGVSATISREWEAERRQSKESYRPGLWDHDREEEEDDDDESEPEDEGPEVAQALVPYLSLIASLPSDHPTLPSSVTLEATFDLFLYAIQAAFIVEGTPQEIKEFNDLVDTELLRVIELRVKAEGAKWDPKMALIKLMRSRDSLGRGRRLCQRHWRATSRRVSSLSPLDAGKLSRHQIHIALTSLSTTSSPFCISPYSSPCPKEQPPPPPPPRRRNPNSTPKLSPPWTISPSTKPESSSINSSSTPARSRRLVRSSRGLWRSRRKSLKSASPNASNPSNAKSPPLADELERAWEEEMEDSVGAGDATREDWETESGPEIASALLPTLLPLILSLPSSHSTTPSVLEMTYSTLLYAASVALSCRGSPCQTSGFIKTVDEELVKLIDLRAKGGEEGWSARRELERLEEEVKDYGEDWEEDGCPFDWAVERLKELGRGEKKEEKGTEGEATHK